MRKATIILTTALSATSILMAHHSFAAEFDASKPVEIKGTLTKLEWTNPHIWLYLDVKDASGNVTKWECEGGPPNTLTRGGWTKSLLKAGDEITINGTRAKDGTNTCNSRSLTMANGRVLGAGSSEGKQ